MDRKGLPSAAELAELRPARCSAGSLKRLPRSLRHRLFGACARGAHAKSVSELLRWPNRSRRPLKRDEHAAACAVCERCIEWAPSARPPAQQLVELVADAVRSIATLPASEPVWVQEAWSRCKSRTKQTAETPGPSCVTPASPGTPASVTAAYSPTKRVIVAQPCTPSSNTNYPNSPGGFTPMSALTPPVERELAPIIRGSGLQAAAGRLRMAAAALAVAADESEEPPASESVAITPEDRPTPPATKATASADLLVASHRTS